MHPSRLLEACKCYQILLCPQEVGHATFAAAYMYPSQLKDHKAAKKCLKAQRKNLAEASPATKSAMRRAGH